MNKNIQLPMSDNEFLPKIKQKKPLCFGRVKEVTEVEGNILMPLSPLDNRATHFFATIIYDLVKLGYEKKDIMPYFQDFLKDNSITNVLAYVTNNGRMIWEDVSKNSIKHNEVIIKV